MKAGFPRLETGHIVPTRRQVRGWVGRTSLYGKPPVTKPQKQLRAGWTLQWRTRQQKRTYDLHIFSWKVHSPYDLHDPIEKIAELNKDTFYEAEAKQNLKPCFKYDNRSWIIFEDF